MIVVTKYIYLSMQFAYMVFQNNKKVFRDE